MARGATRRPGAEKTGLPPWIRPQLTQLVKDTPDGPGWLHEIKFDGYRMHARLDHGAVRLLTRTGLDWTLTDRWWRSSNISYPPTAD